MVQKALKDLSHELGYLPLALAQAGAYIKRQATTVADYLALYRQQSIKMLSENLLPADSVTKTVDGKIKTVAITWDISLAAIEKEEQARTTSHSHFMLRKRGVCILQPERFLFFGHSNSVEFKNINHLAVTTQTL